MKTFPWLGLQVSIPEVQVGWVTSVLISNSSQHSHPSQYLAYYNYYIMTQNPSMFFFQTMFSTEILKLF